MGKILFLLLIFPSILFAQERMISPNGKITKGNFRKAIPKTCTRSGGVDCSKGSDKDGSVICLNGDTDSLQKYADECSESKLTLIEERIEEGINKVTIRNDSGVKAQGVSIYYERLDRTKTLLDGPKELEPFSLGTYEGRQKRAYEDLIIKCESCSIR